MRLYHYDEFEEGSEYYSATPAPSSVVNHPNGACTAAGVRLPDQPQQERERAPLAAPT